MQNKLIGKDVCPLIGKTGCGKSTTIRFLKEIPMQYKEVEVEIKKKDIIKKIARDVLVPIDEKESLPGFKIGHTYNSEI